MRDPVALGALYRSERDALEAAWLEHPASSAEAFAEGDRRLAEWTAAVAATQATDRRPLHLRRYWRQRDRRSMGAKWRRA